MKTVFKKDNNQDGTQNETIAADGWPKTALIPKLRITRDKKIYI